MTGAAAVVSFGVVKREVTGKRVKTSNLSVLKNLVWVDGLMGGSAPSAYILPGCLLLGQSLSLNRKIKSKLFSKSLTN